MYDGGGCICIPDGLVLSESLSVGLFIISRLLLSFSFSFSCFFSFSCSCVTVRVHFIFLFACNFFFIILFFLLVVFTHTVSSLCDL